MQKFGFYSRMIFECEWKLQQKISNHRENVFQVEYRQDQRVETNVCERISCCQMILLLFCRRLVTELSSCSKCLLQKR